MYLPTLKALKVSRDVVDVFGGYNHNLRINEGEFYDMKNMTSSQYPILAPRGRRGTLEYETEDGVYEPKAQALISKDTLCYVDGNKFYMNGIGYEIDGLNGNERTQLISMGAYVIVMPDKVYFNTKNVEDRGKLEAEWNASDYGTKTVTFSMCNIEGEEYSIDTEQISETAPENPVDLQYWVDSSGTHLVLKQWSKVSAMWVSIATTYIKISAEGIGKNFEQYDGVTISGLKDDDSLKTVDGATIAAEDKNTLDEIDGSFVIWKREDDYITIVGILKNTIEVVTSNLKVKRAVPEMDFVTEANNRLWGCRYGVADNGDIVNEIYASKLGDFKNWSCFMGVSTDSYAVSLGSDGEFTGAVTYCGFPIFFKENCLHRIYGNYPSNFQAQLTSARGVQSGSHKSIAIVNERLYYKSANGVCAYDGSIPVDIGYSLGNIEYGNAVAGSHNGKYYISMTDSAGIPHLFVYDTQKSMWHREDNTQVMAFCSNKNEMYYIDAATGGIKTMNGSGTIAESVVPWMVETGTIGTTMPDQKYISRLVVRMSLNVGTKVTFFIEHDSTGEWVKLFTMEGKTLRSFDVPIRPRRCDHFKIRIEGEGDARIYSVAKNIEQGSDHTR